MRVDGSLVLVRWARGLMVMMTVHLMSKPIAFWGTSRSFRVDMRIEMIT